MRPFAGSLTAIILLVAAAACGPERNRAPIVELSASTSEVAVGDEVSVDGSASSDPDGDPLVFHWTFERPEQSGVDLGSPRGESITFRPDVPGTYTVGLSVTDGEFTTATQSVSVEATGSAEPPVADAGADQSVVVGDEVTLDGSASTHPQGAQLAYAWSIEERPGASTAELDDPAVAQPSFVPDAAGDFVVGLVVSGGGADSEMDTFVVTATSAGQPPVADAGDDQTVSVGQEVVLDGSASSDPDDGALDFSWTFASTPDGSVPTIQDNTSPVAHFTPLEAGLHEVQLEVRDPDDMTDVDTVRITAESSLSPICMFISEYIEGSSFNKAVELYNCGDDAIDLAQVGFCVAINENPTCASSTYDMILSGTIAADEVLTLCHPQIDPAHIDDCDVVTNTVTFNGDDRLVVYEDVDGSGDFTPEDDVIDAFGEIANQPSGPIWSGMTLRRCNFTRFDGESAFDYQNYYNKAAEDDFSDFGVPPTHGCD